MDRFIKIIAILFYLSHQDEGEFLELPPPDASVYFEGEDILDDEDRLQAMLEDPDNFDDYPKDWDRYISGYVVSWSIQSDRGWKVFAVNKYLTFILEDWIDEFIILLLMW